MKTAFVSIPGKVMLAGEYAVLDGGHALAFTVSRYLNVSVSQTPTPGLAVTSDLWHEAKFFGPDSLPSDSAEPLLHSAAAAMQRTRLNGASVSVNSDLPVTYGLGSSSALRLGLHLAFQGLTQGLDGRLAEEDAWQLATLAVREQRQSQKQASGYDVATQLAGGLVLMEPDAEHWPGRVTRLPKLHGGLTELVEVWVGGDGADTGPIAGATRGWLKEQKRGQDLMAVSQELCVQFQNAFENPNDEECVHRLCELMGRHRRFFRDAPAFPRRLATNLESLYGLDRTWSYKTTGAGGEDAILLVGYQSEIREAQTRLRQLGWHHLNAPYTMSGASLSVRSED